MSEFIANNEAVIAIIITVITVVSFVMEKIPLAMTALISALCMGILLPDVPLASIYEGAASTTVMMVGGMSIVGDSLFKSGMANKIGLAIGNTSIAKSERGFLIVVCIACTIMSAFLSNSGTIAMWMPLIAACAAKSNGVIRSKMIIMAAGMCCAIGGAATLVGSTSQQTANNALISYAQDALDAGTLTAEQTEAFNVYVEGLGVFDQTKVMIPICIVMIIYFATIGYSLSKKVLKPEDSHFNDGNYYYDLELQSNSEDNDADKRPAWHGYLSLAVLIMCIVGFILTGQKWSKAYFNVGVIGLVGAAILITSGVMPLKKTLAEMDWNTLVILAAAQGFATGLNKSGGGKLIATTIVDFFGGAEASTAVLMASGVVVTVVLTNFMSNTALAAMMTPIYCEIAMILGISPIPFVIAIGAIATNLACATPVGTPACTQTLPAGYKYMEYVKIGLPLCVICMVMAAVLCPLMYSF